jgi:hypothetical protein
MPMPRLNGWRGAGLLFAALASCLPRGFRYTFDLPHTLPAGIDSLSLGGVLIQVLGVMWFIAAGVGVWSAFRLRDLSGVFAIAFMHALWAAALFLGWIFEAGDWLSAANTFGIFGLIVCWSRMINPPTQVDIEELLSHRAGGE